VPPRDWKLRVEDISLAIERIQRYTVGLTLEAFRTDDLRIDAVIRCLGIIGEAARHVPDDVQEKYPDVPWSEMRGIRNVVMHEYFGVVLEVVWQTIQEDLPPLVPRLTEILDQETR
jgi:uncharacterized protein with HEPN domain